jgi:hypothetical protein
MVYTIIVVFSLAAIFGITLLSFVLRNKQTPKAVVFLHGPIAAIGLILLIYYVATTGANLVTSIVLFVIAALGGIILVSRDFMGKPIPKWLAVVHGLIAVSGFVYLLNYAFNIA